MEEMGGGGHLSNAACQIKDKPMDEVLNHLKEIIEANNEMRVKKNESNFNRWC